MYLITTCGLDCAIFLGHRCLPFPSSFWHWSDQYSIEACSKVQVLYQHCVGILHCLEDGRGGITPPASTANCSWQHPSQWMGLGQSGACNPRRSAESSSEQLLLTSSPAHSVPSCYTDDSIYMLVFLRDASLPLWRLYPVFYQPSKQAGRNPCAVQGKYRGICPSSPSRGVWGQRLDYCF